MAQQRIYLVGTPDNKVRLIKASLRQQAYYREESLLEKILGGLAFTLFLLMICFI